VVGLTEAALVRSLSAEAKWLAGECAPARDLHVFLNETVSEVPPAVKRVASRLAKVHLERARTALTGVRYNAFTGQLASFGRAEGSTSPNRLDDFGRAVLDQRHGKVEKRGHRIASLDGKRLHRLRIAIKKLRYAATFLHPAFASRASKAYIEATVRLQGALGALNDREVAGQMLADIAVAARPAEDVERPLRKLAKQAAAGEKHRRRRLQRAWKTFRKTERFWRA
jgi:CHAD domain-containing protein